MDEVPESLDVHALAARLKVSARTLRAWIAANVLPRPAFHGHKTRYERSIIIRAHAVAALRRDAVPLPHVGRFLANKSELELREIGGLPPPRAPGPPPALPPPAPPLAALPSSTSTSAGEPASESGMGAAPGGGAETDSPTSEPAPEPPPHGETGLVTGARPPSDSLAVHGTLATRDEASGAGVPVGAEWRRIELLPGLELHVRADASPFVHGLAAAIASGRFTR